MTRVGFNMGWLLNVETGWFRHDHPTLLSQPRVIMFKSCVLALKHEIKAQIITSWRTLQPPRNNLSKCKVHVSKMRCQEERSVLSKAYGRSSFMPIREGEREGGNYCIWAYPSFIQHKTLKNNMQPGGYFSFSWFDAGISFLEVKLATNI